jgi:hypothetical protein
MMVSVSCPMVFLTVCSGICLVCAVLVLADFGGVYCKMVFMCSNLTAARLVN